MGIRKLLVILALLPAMLALLLPRIPVVEARTFSWVETGYEAQENIILRMDDVWTTGNSYTVEVTVEVLEIDTNTGFLSLYNNDYIKLTEVELDIGYKYKGAASPFVTMRKGDVWQHSWTITPKASDFFLSKGESTTETARLEITSYVVEKDGTEHQLFFYTSEVKVKIIGGEDASKEGGGGCFIATAVYGTSEAKDIDVLRSIRDEVLMPTPLGKAFVETYYLTSPPIADVLRQNGGLRVATRIFLVAPLVFGAKLVSSVLGLFTIGCLIGILFTLLQKYHKLGVTLKALGLGVVTAILLISSVFLLGYFAYTWPACAIIAAYILPMILPISIFVIALQNLWAQNSGSDQQKGCRRGAQARHCLSQRTQRPSRATAG